jgi:hypothetical protein
MVTLLVLGLGALAGFEFFQIKQYKDAALAADDSASEARSQVADVKSQNEHLRSQLTTVQNESLAQTQERILQEVTAQYAVPKNETPSFAQINDKSQLAGQDFFKDAENADFLIIYAKAKLSILYRPSEHKIIASGPIEVKSQ